MANQGARKPTAQKELEGTLRADRTNPLEPRLPAELPDRPEWADDDKRTSMLFDQITEYISEMQIATRVDGIAISLLADQLDLYLKLREDIRLNGLTVSIENREGKEISTKPNPTLVALNSTFANIMRLLTQYGLTAASRSQVNMIKDETADSFDAFLEGK